MEPLGKKAKLEVAETTPSTDASYRFEAEGALDVAVVRRILPSKFCKGGMPDAVVDCGEHCLV